jgi:hypothetical protein
MTLPSFAMPNVTEVLQGTKASLYSAAQSAVVSHYSVRPFNCPNGKPLVTCLFNVCPKDKCASNQVRAREVGGGAGASSGGGRTGAGMRGGARAGRARSRAVAAWRPQMRREDAAAARLCAVARGRSGPAAPSLRTLARPQVCIPDYCGKCGQK